MKSKNKYYNTNIKALISLIFVFVIIFLCLMFPKLENKEAFIMGEEIDPDEIANNNYQELPPGTIDKININTANKDELNLLPGIGEKLAEKILEYRASNGNFNQINELMKVSGIGQKNFEKLKEFITVN